MSFYAWLIFIAIWNLYGFALWGFLAIIIKVPGMACTEGIEFVNPAYLYHHINVNWFGAFFLSTLYGLMCPIATFIYWFYKLCTVGRKSDK